MATWMVHLRIAEMLLGEIPTLEPAHFSVGSVAPDSGIPDEKWEHFDPPVSVTHFCEEQWFATARDLDFYHRYFQNVNNQSDPQRDSFLWGYFCHLATDNLWNDIRVSTYKKYQPQFDADRNFVWEIKRDWYGLDHLYAFENPDSLYWRVFMNCEYRTDCLDFLPPAALIQRVDYIRKEYQPDEEQLARIRQRPFEYLNRQQMDDFVGVSSVKIRDWMRRLQQGDPVFQSFDSVTQIKE